MKIYLVSLERDIERRLRLKKTFPLHWSKFTWIKAIDAIDIGNQTLVAKYDSNCPQGFRKPLTLGEKCCAISHIRCLQNFLKTWEPFCIIIEDDIDGCDTDFFEAVEVVKSLPSNSSLAILGGQQGMKNSKHLSGYSLCKNLWRIPRVSMPFLTRACCYAVSREAARKILESQEACLRRSDIWEYYSTLGIDIFYSNIFKHPINLQASHLERERITVGFVESVLTDGLLNIVTRFFAKILLAVKVFLGKLSRVEIK